MSMVDDACMYYVYTYVGKCPYENFAKFPANFSKFLKIPEIGRPPLAKKSVFPNFFRNFNDFFGSIRGPTTRLQPQFRAKTSPDPDFFFADDEMGIQVPGPVRIGKSRKSQKVAQNVDFR